MNISVVIEEEEPSKASEMRFAYGYLRIEAGKLRLELFRETECIINLTAEGLFHCLLEMSERKSTRVAWAASWVENVYSTDTNSWLIKEKGQLFMNFKDCQLMFPFNDFRDALQLGILSMPPRVLK